MLLISALPAWIAQKQADAALVGNRIAHGWQQCSCLGWRSKASATASCGSVIEYKVGRGHKSLMLTELWVDLTPIKLIFEQDD
jgi:hypothetical protein